MTEVFMTAEGKKQLEERLEYLKVHGRADMSEKIRVAREFGDISENAEYDIAKDEQAKLEAEIIDIEAKLRVVQVIDDSKIKTDVVSLGNFVKILDIAEKEELEFKIVGTHESNPMENFISNESPVGKALLGRKKGETVTVDAIEGKIQFKILKIS